MTNARAEAKAICEHYWAYHCYDGLVVRLCQLCHEPDWDDVRAEQQKAAAAERERIARFLERPHALRAGSWHAARVRKLAP